MPATFSLSLLEMDIVDEDLRLGRWVHPFQIPYVSPTFAERKQQRDAVWQALAADGLAYGEKLLAEVEETLTAWAKPDVLITQVATVMEDGSNYRYRAGWRGAAGFMSRQEGDRLVFDERKPDQIALDMVGFLPSWAPFRGCGVTTTTAAPVQERPGFAHPSPTARFGEAQRFFDYPLLRYGVIDVLVASPGGRLDKSGTLLWFDSVEGRFTLEEERLRDGSRHLTCTPTAGSHVTSWITNKISEALAA